MDAWNPLETSSLTDIRRDIGSSDLQDEILVGLNAKNKYLPSVLLWDNEGLARFEAVRTTTSIDYYPSKKETKVIKRNTAEIARTIPTGATLVELGSGNTEKAALILSALQRQDKSVTYHALDLSPVALLSSLAVLTETFPRSSCIGCCGLLGSYDDFLAWLAQKPKQLKPPVILLWLGNSIGNLDASDASALLARFGSCMATKGLQFIIGVDGCRDPSQIERCYNPANAVTHEFLMNGLDQANKVLGQSVFRKEEWTCIGFYDTVDTSWKSYYVARRDLELESAESTISIGKGERILAIRSAKWTQNEVEKLSSAGGFRVAKTWKDGDTSYGGRVGMAQAVPGPISARDLLQLKQWNKDVPHPTPCCVHDLVEEQRSRLPNASAVESWDGTITYQRLDELSSRLAHHLGTLGAIKETFVPLCFEKSMWAVVSMMAVLKAGAAFTFIEPSHPPDRIQSVLQDTNASILLTSGRVSPIFAKGKSSLNHIIEVTATFVYAIDMPANALLPQAKPNNAAVALFTSGSTGKPKGIIQEHSTAAFSAQTCAKTFGIGPGSRVLQWAAYCFDMSVIDMLMALVGGGCICIPSEQMRMNRLEGAMREMKVDCAAMTPSTAQILKSAVLPDLRTLVLGGEAVSREHLEGWPGHIRIINGYGPGEASVCVAGDALVDCPGNIGKAVGSVVWIVDECSYDTLTPVGTIGELLIEGPLLARGYLNDPVKTAASFIENPPWLEHFRGKSGKATRLYKTGDLGRYHADGSIEFMGRKDSQIKLRGQRIEPGDIEYHISQSLPAGASVAVDVVAPAGGSAASQLAVFVGLDGKRVSTRGSESLIAIDMAGKEELLSHIQGLQKKLSIALPVYMIPSYVIPLKHLPLTASGKLDRKLLRQIGSSLAMEQLSSLSDTHQSRQEDSRDVEAFGQMQRKIAELWLSVLPTHPPQIRTNDDFFKLGGDSINAMQLVQAASKSNIRLTTGKIFQHPTLGGMSSAALETMAAEGQANVSINDCGKKDSHMKAMMEEMHCPGLQVEADNIENLIKAPDMQAYMVACGLLKTHGYINYFAFDLSGPIDGPRLEKSCRTLVARHSVLRTVFALHAGHIHQVVLKNYNMDFAHHTNQEETEALLTNLCAMDINCETQLGANIVRFQLVKRAGNHHILIMRLSHAQFDGTSLSLIYRDLQMLYANETLPVAPPFTDWALASHAANSLTAESYWRGLLHGASMTSILAHSKPPYAHIINTRISLTIPFTPVQPHGITVATLVKASWAVVLASLASTTDVVFGNAVTGRNLPLPGIDHIVGDCNNAVLVRINLAHAPTALSLLQQIQSQLVAAIPYETIGCRQLVERCTDWPRWTRYSTSVNHQNYTSAGMNEFHLGEAKCRVSYKDLESDRRDIQIYSYPPTSNGKLRLEMAFSNSALSAATVEKMLQRLGETVQRLSGDVDAPIELLPSPIGCSIPLPIPSTPVPVPVTITTTSHSNPTTIHHPSSPSPLPQTSISIPSPFDPTATVNKIWHRFESLFPSHLATDPTITTTTTTTTTPQQPPLDAHTPFYALGGDLVYAAQLSGWYAHEGIMFPIEEIIECPSKAEQIELLARRLAASA
ncbi:MAG: hypothetical protein Q9208_006002 [Pyrenodesmia sp. 3 TL-2023]